LTRPGIDSDPSVVQPVTSLQNTALQDLRHLGDFERMPVHCPAVWNVSLKVWIRTFTYLK
jgi:hypothetical protein